MKSSSKFQLLVAAYVHDLKNQLQSLTSQQNLLITELPAEYQQQLTPMLRQTNQIKEDTLRLVSLFRLESKDCFAMDDAWPRDTASDAIESCQLQFPEVTIENNIRFDSQGFYNEQLIKLALITLITNSAQAGAKRVKIECSEDESQSLQIEVHDDGPGFIQGVIDGTTDTTKAEGSGLGLSFVEMICQAHKGTDKQGSLTISNSAKGAIATLFIP